MVNYPAYTIHRRVLQWIQEIGIGIQWAKNGKMVQKIIGMINKNNVRNCYFFTFFLFSKNNGRIKNLKAQLLSKKLKEIG